MKKEPYRPFREDYEIGERWGSFVVQRPNKHVFASFDTKKQAEDFLDSCPSRKDSEVKKLISF
jgi:hypothetical protein